MNNTSYYILVKKDVRGILIQEIHIVILNRFSCPNFGHYSILFFPIDLENASPYALGVKTTFAIFHL